MAVCLLREGERRSTQPQSPETRRLPRVTVINRPVAAAPHWRGTLRARTPTHVCYSQPEREEVWRETFQRRKVQQCECGFHGPAHQPYKDVGHVELDDVTLILDGLGQKQDKQLSVARSPSPATAVTPSHLPTSPPPPPRPQLRSMAPQLPDDLSLLPEEMRGGEERRGEVKVGRGLFQSLTARETAKKEATDGKEMESRAQTNDWRPPDVTFDPTTLATSRRTSVHIETRPSTVTFDLMTGRSRSERRGSQQVAIETSSHDNLVHSSISDSHCGSHGNQQTLTDRPLTSEGCVSGEGVEEVGSGEEGEGCEGEVCDGEEGGNEDRVSDSHQSGLVYQWYRQLCVLLWVMDGLKLDSNTHLPPFSQCWQLDRERVQKSHSLAVSRGHTPSRNQQRYNSWKNNTSTPAYNGSPQSGTAQFNPLNPPRDGHMISRDGHMTSDSSHHLTPSDYRRLKRQTAREEQRLRKQDKLSQSQMEALIKSVDEELNFSKKTAKARVQSLREGGGCGRSPSPSSLPPPPPPPSHLLAMERVRERFTEAEVTKTMTVHHQLLAMQRDRGKALEQRLAHLEAGSSLWRDLTTMRQGVKIESTTMARNKLLMNFYWFQDLLECLPEEVKTDRYCSSLLSLLSLHSRYSTTSIGPQQWSKKRLIGILSTLRPWELRCPETATAMKFLTERVIYILPEDYEKWLEYHTLTTSTSTNYTPATAANTKLGTEQTTQP